MIAANLQIAEAAGAPSALARALQAAPGLASPVLVNLDIWPDLAALVARSTRFADAAGPGDSLILTILTASADRATLDWQMAEAGAWAFTRHAALAWAPRGVRLNMIAVGAASPPGAGPASPGQTAAPAAPASLDDVVRTAHAIAGWPSMTGQIIRLGGT